MLPIYHQIDFIDLDDEVEISRIIKDSLVGEVPCFIDLNSVDAEQILSFVSIFSKKLEAMRINPFFPFPIYLIISEMNTVTEFPVVSHIDRLPRHFSAPQQRSTSKREKTIMNRINLNQEKIRNRNITSDLKKLGILKKDKRLLYQLSKDNYFLKYFLDFEKSKVKEYE